MRAVRCANSMSVQPRCTCGLAGALLLLIAGSANGDVIVLNCETSSLPRSSNFKFDIEIDLELREIHLGRFRYEITQTNDFYISARSESDAVNVGGEILVLNRTNGDLKRIAIYLAATLATLSNPKQDHNRTSELVAKDFSGSCTKPIL